MEIKLNGKDCQIPDNATADDLLKIRGYKGKTAIWVNNAQLLLAEYQGYVLKEADQVRILRIIGGG